MTTRSTLFLLAAVLLTPTTLALLPGSGPSALATDGRWLAPFDGQTAAINMVLLHNDKVLYWSGVEARERDNVFFEQGAHHSEARVLDLDTMTVTDVIDVPGGADLFCSGQTVLGDGHVLTAGGTEWTGAFVDQTPLWGLYDSFTFDPDTLTWTQEEDMAQGRWYPSVIHTPEGDGLVASGVYNLVDPSTHVELVERFHEGEWTMEPGANRLLPLYPRIHVVPGGPLKGDLFYQTVGTLWGPFGEHPIEPAWSLQQVFDFDTDTWTYLGPSIGGARQHANAVPKLLEADRGYAPEIVTFGGTLQRSTVATGLTEVADLATNPPTNRLAEPLEHPRWHANGVLLPDGSIVAIGGGLYDNVVVHGQPNVAVLAAERYDPDTDTWDTLAAMSVERMYHSTALLLPDGRVLAGGHVPLPIPWKDVRDNVDGQAQIVETDFEIFEPPYLFWDARPVITSAPATGTWGETITVKVDDTAALSSVVLMRPGSVTHSYDADQRGIVLAHSVVDSDKISVTLPPDAVVAPPGHWMLFVNNADSLDRGDVPSKAAWIALS